MTLVLSMNPFCEHEAEAPPPIYQPIWESEHCSTSCVSTPTPGGGNAQELVEEPPGEHVPDHAPLSRIAYFKRKYVEDDDLPLNFRGYCHTVSPVLEEHTHILRLSLEKMRFIDDPEAFLRRSVLINNLLRRLRTEILLQRDWRFPSGPITMAAATSPAHLHPSTAAGATISPGPNRKRLRGQRAEEAKCVPACCCLYTPSQYRYLQLPLCVYEETSCNVHPSSSSSLSSSSSSSDELLEDELDSDGDGDEGLDSLCPGLDLCEASFRAKRERYWKRNLSPLRSASTSFKKD